MSADTPLLRVSRAVSACAPCRRAKIRCDSKLPACSTCEKNGKAKECSAADQSARYKEQSYVAFLETRIERLTKQITQRREQLVNSGSTVSTTPPVAVKVAKRKEASDVDDLVSDFGYMSVNATSSGYHGFTQEMSFARLVLSTSSITELPQPSATNLPPRGLATGLVDEFIKRVLHIYPILSDTQIFGSLDAVYQHNGRYCPARESWNIRLILAIGSLLRSNSRGDPHYQDAVHHAAIALEQRESVLQPGHLSTVQSLLLLVIYATLDPVHFDCWYLKGVAARLLVDIGLHQDNNAGNETIARSNQASVRRRVFHCVFALDRLISLTYVRSLSFSDDSVDVALPSSSPQYSQFGDLTNTMSLLPLTVEVIEFRQVQSVAYHEIFASSRAVLLAPWQSRVHVLRRVGDWIAGLPESSPASVKQLLLAEMYYLYVLLMRPPGGHADLGLYGTALLLEYCIGFIRTIRLVCDPLWTTPYICNMEFKRTEYVGRIILEIVLGDLPPVLDIGGLHSPPVQSTEFLPPLQRSSASEKKAQAYTAVTQLKEAITIMGEKFGRSRAVDRLRVPTDRALEKMSH